VKAGWGRLGGSAIAGLSATLVYTTLGASPITGAMTFILASLVCEAFQWKALTGQAGAISALISAEPNLSRDPGSYAWSRVFDNAIGVIVGTAVTAFFWPENPRQKLQDNLETILDYTSQCFETIIGSVVSKNSSAEVDEILAKISSLAQQSENILNKSLYGFLGRQLIQDNWSDKIVAERRLRRHLFAMTRILRDEQENALLLTFSEELLQLTQTVTTACKSLSHLIGLKKLDMEQPNLTEDSLSKIISQLNQMWSIGKTDAYSLQHTIQFYDLLSTVTRFTKDLDQLALKLRAQAIAISQPKPPWRFQTYPLPAKQVKHFLTVGMALGITLAFIKVTNLSYGYYAVIALIVAMQPSLGKGIDAGRQRVLGTGVGALVAVVVVNTLGGNPLTVGLGVIFTILICSFCGLSLGGYRPGCFIVIITIMVHSNEPSSYIFGRFSETLFGFIIAMTFSLIVPPETASQKVDPNLSLTFSNLGKLYQLIIDNYLQRTASKTEITELIADIRKAIQTQTTLQIESKSELMDNFKAATFERRWNFILSYGKIIFTNLLLLYQTTTIPENSQGVAGLFLQELQNSKQSIVLGLQQIAIAVNSQTNPPYLASLYETYIVFEQKLEQLQPLGTMQQYSLEQIISFLSVVSTLKEITETLNHMTQHWPTQQSMIGLDSTS